MKNYIMASIRLTLVCALLFSGIYTTLIWGIAQITPQKGKGEIVMAKGQYYYANIGQNFSGDQYFHARPSAVGYNAAGSGGSNKGPSNPDYLMQIQARVDTFLAHNPSIKRFEIPSDLITASGSGLDPHISVQAAKTQVKRVALARGMSENTVLQLVEKEIEKPLFGCLGTERVNVLKLNLALEAR